MFIHCKHENRNDDHGQVNREINRSYKLPSDIDTSSIKSHLTQKGILQITANKK